jgi:hypothetical protein
MLPRAPPPKKQSNNEKKKKSEPRNGSPGQNYEHKNKNKNLIYFSIPVTKERKFPSTSREVEFPREPFGLRL